MEQSIRELSIQVAQNKALPTQPERLTRRKRWIIVDADFYKDDHAVIWFVRRGHSGTPVDEIHRMEKVDGVWRSPGGSGGEPGADLDERPTLAEIAALNDRNPFSRCEFGFNSGGSSGSRRRPSSRQIHCAQEVTELRFSDGRPPKPVASHGHVIVLYKGNSGPTISAFDVDGQPLGEHKLKPVSHPRIPLRHRLRARFSSGWIDLSS